MIMDISEILHVLFYALIVIVGIVGSVLDYQKKNKNKNKNKPKMPEKREKHGQTRRFPKDGDSGEIVRTTPPQTVKNAPPKAPVPKPKKHREDDSAYIIEHKAEPAKRSARTEAAPPPSEPENTLVLQARTGIIWSEILQPPVSMR
jgi:hypothetical protein